MVNREKYNKLYASVPINFHEDLDYEIENKGVRHISNDVLVNAFIWSYSERGKDFWFMVYKQPFHYRNKLA